MEYVGFKLVHAVLLLYLFAAPPIMVVISFGCLIRRQHHGHPLGFHCPDSPPGSIHDEMSKRKIPKIKKPLNAFMLFMKEMRAKVIEECSLKESAAINQILGRRVSDLFKKKGHTHEEDWENKRM